MKSLVLIVCLLTASIVSAQVITVNGDVTTNTTWTNNNIYLLVGDVIVKNGATLTIEPGTLIKGDKPTIGRLIVSRTGAINANGTAERPIVFTSNQAVGSRAPGDWGGIAIIGDAPSNAKDAGGNPIDLRLECGTTTDYDGGGTNNTDNSGIFRYVRIEYAGVACAPNKELNGLTMLCVGSGTTIDHVQVSFGGDDAFEWFGGSVNCNYLIAYANTDDDFDSDNGWSGKVQFGVVVRDGAIADAAGDSNFFETDNDATGTSNQPFTSSVFSNITCVGPYETPSTVVAADAYYGRAARLRRNNKQKIWNSVFIGHKRGLFIEGTTTQTNATNGELIFRNNIIAGSKLTNAQVAFDSAYVLNPANAITLFAANTDVQLTAPYGTTRNFLPLPGSPALSGFDYSHPSLAGFQQVPFRGAFGNEDWTACWAEWNPATVSYATPGNDYSLTASVTASGATQICPGQSLTLNATSSDASATFIWSNNATGNSISVAAPGTYFVTARSSRGCQGVSSPVSVSFFTVTSPVVTGNTSYCPGSSVTLTASNASAYNWSTGGQSSTLNVTSPGFYSVTTTDVNGCTAASAPFSVNAYSVSTPVITASGPTSFCTGDSVTLQSSAAVSYLWSDNSTDATLLVQSSGNYTVTTTDANGCTASSSPQIVSVSSSPAPTISINGATSFCAGGQVQLTSSQGESFLWSDGSTSQSVTITQAGSYTVSVTNTNACLGTGTSSPVVVTVNDNPEASFSYSLTNGQLQLTNSSAGAGNYIWDFGDGSATSSANSPAHTYTADGSYDVTLTAISAAGCSDDTIVSVTVVIIGIADEIAQIENLQLYPNPVVSVATLSVTAREQASMVVRITDLSGRMVYESQFELIAGTQQFPLELSALPAGVYAISCEQAGKIKAAQFIKR